MQQYFILSEVLGYLPLEDNLNMRLVSKDICSNIDKIGIWHYVLFNKEIKKFMRKSR